MEELKNKHDDPSSGEDGNDSRHSGEEWLEDVSDLFG